jgi:hypothetical protein
MEKSSVIETHFVSDDSKPVREQAFDVFVQQFSSTRVNRWDDCLVYGIIHRKFAKAFLIEAEQLIKDWQLPLQARISYNTIDATIIIEER